MKQTCYSNHTQAFMKKTVFKFLNFKSLNFFPMKNKVNLPFFMMVTMLVMTGMSVKAQDWAQWRGPNREGIFKGANLNLDWSAKKPTLLWTFRQAGSGYSAPTIIGTTLYCQGGADGNDFAFALDTQTGKEKWKQNLGEIAVLQRGDGPRGSVTVDGNKLYLIRGGGQIHCLSATDGKMLWQKDFEKDFGGKLMSRWGYSESPLIDGNHVICSPGGADGNVIALDKNTGNLVWRTKELTDNAGHSSPIVADVNGIRQYILLTANNVAGIAAKDGRLLWTVAIEGGPRGVSATIPTPVYMDNMVYVTNGYEVGCMGIKLTKDGDDVKAETVYKNKDIASQHGGVVLMNGYVYGYTESRSWACQNMKNGEIVWSERNPDIGKGAVLGVNDRLLLLDMQTGRTAIIAASPEGWKEFGRMEIPERSKITTQDNHVWTHPVIANDKLYIRDQDLLFCFDLKK